MPSIQDKYPWVKAVSDKKRAERAENMPVADKFLQTRGRLVEYVADVKKDDILARVRLCDGIDSNSQPTKYSEVELHVVKYVVLTPGPPNLQAPIPYAGFLPAKIGLRTSETEILYSYLATSAGSEPGYYSIWRPKKGQEAILNEWGEPTDNVENYGNVYLVEDEFLRQLGATIPAMCMPVFSFLPQGRDINKLLKFAKEAAPVIEQARQIHQKLEYLSYAVSR